MAIADLPLLSTSDFSYAGSFRLEDPSDVTHGHFQNGAGFLTYDDATDSLYVSGSGYNAFGYQGGVCRCSIPGSFSSSTNYFDLPMGMIVTPFRSFSDYPTNAEGIPDWPYPPDATYQMGTSNGPIMRGCIRYNGNHYLNIATQYGYTPITGFRVDGTNLKTGTCRSIKSGITPGWDPSWTTENTERFIAGNFWPVPSDWQSELGNAKLFCGNGCLSTVQTCGSHLGVFAFDPDTAGSWTGAAFGSITYKALQAFGLREFEDGDCTGLWYSSIVSIAGGFAVPGTRTYGTFARMHQMDNPLARVWYRESQGGGVWKAKVSYNNQPGEPYFLDDSYLADDQPSVDGGGQHCTDGLGHGCYERRLILWDANNLTTGFNSGPIFPGPDPYATKLVTPTPLYTSSIYTCCGTTYSHSRRQLFNSTWDYKYSTGGQAIVPVIHVYNVSTPSTVGTTSLAGYGYRLA